MSMDAFAVCIAKGVHLKNPTLSDSLKTGLIFGLTETITPMIGYFLGVLFSEFVANIDHWIAFVLLVGLGIHFIYNALNEPKPQNSDDKSNNHLLLLTAFATSIDAMVIGISLAFVKANIWLAMFLIGFITTCMATMGIYLGYKLGQKIGKTAEIIGGFLLIGIGSFILYTHLT